MRKISVKKPRTLKISRGPSKPVCSSIPFLFSVAVDITKDSKQKSSFNRELSKITKKLGPVLEKNDFKNQIPQHIDKNNSGLPYQRRARSSSPPRDSLKFSNKNFSIFPCGHPVVPLIDSFPIEEDLELKAIKEEYLRMLESAQENKTTECEDFDEEEYEIQKIINNLCLIDKNKNNYDE